MADYFLEIDDNLIKEVRQSIADPGYDIIDNKIIRHDLMDALDFVCMIAAEDVELRFIRRCVIRYAAYISYRNYTTLAESRYAALPESAPIIMQTLLMQSFNCLSYITQVPINSDLSVNLNGLGTPVADEMSPTLIER